MAELRFDFRDGWGEVPAKRLETGTVIALTATLAVSAKIGLRAKIGSYAKIGSDAEIGPGAEIGSYAEIGSDAKIGSYAEIGSYAKIGSDAKIGSYAKIGSDAEIGPGAEIGSYAEIGPGAKIGSYAKIGSGGSATGVALAMAWTGYRRSDEKAPGLYISIGCQLKLAAEWEALDDEALDQLLGTTGTSLRVSVSAGVAAIRTLVAFLRIVLPETARDDS